MLSPHSSAICLRALDILKLCKALQILCATGKHFVSAVLTGVRSGKAPHPFLVWTLSEVLVTGFQQSGSADGTFDQFTLQFNKIRIVYTPQKDDGSAGIAVVGEFDRKAGKS